MTHACQKHMPLHIHEGDRHGLTIEETKSTDGKVRQRAKIIGEREKGCTLIHA